MALEISEFADVGYSVKGQPVPVVEGPPITVSTTTGAKTMSSRTRLIRIKGSGTITWSNDEAETFDSLEFRRVQPGATLTVS